jgi:hypothetical protein
MFFNSFSKTAQDPRDRPELGKIKFYFGTWKTHLRSEAWMIFFKKDNRHYFRFETSVTPIYTLKNMIIYLLPAFLFVYLHRKQPA